VCWQAFDLPEGVSVSAPAPPVALQGRTGGSTAAAPRTEPARSRRRKWLLAGVAFALGILLIGGLAAGLFGVRSVLGNVGILKGLATASPMVGKEAPEIMGEDLDGNLLRLSDYRGKVVFLEFWADWCPFCQQAYPYQKRLANRLGFAPFVLLGVNGDRNRDDARRVTRANGVPSRSWWDGAGTGSPIAQQWDVDGVPTTFLIDHKGVVRYKFVGAQPDHVLDAAVDELVREVPKE
jgi:thiol-disulfide isomerase/thioredoxin